MSKLIRWSGSKKSCSSSIISYFPRKINTYYECFLGGGAVLLELLQNFDKYNIECNHFVGNDINKDLISVWNIIKLNPILLYNYYSNIYNEFIKLNSLQEKKEFYTYKRNYYNSLDIENEERPLLFYWLIRTCFNGLIRYNKKCEFNSSYHLNRNGIRPNELLSILMEASAMLKKYNVEFQFMSFESIFGIAKEGDLLYCDPPYENVKTNSMYLKNSFNSSTLFNELKKLNDRNIKWLLSYDGLELLKSKNIIIPENMYKRHIEIVQSSSSYRNLSNSKTKNNTIKESLFCNFE